MGINCWYTTKKRKEVEEAKKEENLKNAENK